jgi:hypothetical protein
MLKVVKWAKENSHMDREVKYIGILLLSSYCYYDDDDDDDVVIALS